MTGDVFRIVFICTGNRFRSPLAEAVFRHETDGLPVEVESLGTLDVGTAGVLPGAGEAASALGLDLSQHQARPLAGRRLDAVDLVVGFERIHVAAAVVEAGAARDVAFTLPELVDLLEQTDYDETASTDVVETARRRIRRAAAAEPAALAEVRDPLGLAPAAQRAIADEVRDLTARLSRALFP